MTGRPGISQTDYKKILKQYNPYIETIDFEILNPIKTNTLTTPLL